MSKPLSLCCQYTGSSLNIIGIYQQRPSLLISLSKLLKCAEAKQLSGCFECTELADCKKGYYSKEEEYTAKATALFIQKYGETVYTQALKNAIEDGVNYAGSFDETGSVEAAFRLLEKYILPESR